MPKEENEKFTKFERRVESGDWFELWANGKKIGRFTIKKGESRRVIVNAREDVKIKYSQKSG